MINSQNEASDTKAPRPDAAAILMKDGCPVDLHQPMELYERLGDFFDRIGQCDGYWSEEGKESIPKLFQDCPLTTDLQAFYEPGFEVRVTERVQKLFANHGDGLHDWAHELYWMERFGFEFAYGWKIFAIGNGKRTCWIATGLLFPEYDGKTEGWAVFAELDEIFPAEDRANATP